MRILVTGASGFIGSQLVPKLKELGHEVWPMVRYVSGRFNFYDDSRLIMADLRDGNEVREAILKAKPEAIIHLAAQSAVSYSFTHPEEVNEVVYMGTVRVANAAKGVGAWMIHASTSEVYGRGDHKYPLEETERLGGTSPYAAAKVAAEEYLRVMESTYGMPLTIVRPFNTIGRAPVNNRHFVVERAITQAIERGGIQLHDPRPYRDFMFRDDHVAGYLAVVAAGYPRTKGAFNLCTGGCWRIDEMANTVAAVVAKRLKKDVNVEFSQVPDRPLDILRLHGSNEKAWQELGWATHYNIRQAIEQAAEEWIERLKA